MGSPLRAKPTARGRQRSGSATPAASDLRYRSSVSWSQCLGSGWQSVNWRPAHEPVQTRSDSIEGENTDMKLIAGSAILLTVAIASAWADAADGKVVFEAKCKMCHGADGKGN